MQDGAFVLQVSAPLVNQTLVLITEISLNRPHRMYQRLATSSTKTDNEGGSRDRGCISAVRGNYAAVTPCGCASRFSSSLSRKTVARSPRWSQVCLA